MAVVVRDDGVGAMRNEAITERPGWQRGLATGLPM